MSRQFDELKEIKFRSLPYEQFFGEMELNEQEKERYIALAEQFEILFLYFFMIFIDDESQIEYYQQFICDGYIRIVNDFLNVEQTSAYITEYVNKYSQNFVDVTYRHQNDTYYTSYDRARLNAENETLTVANYKDYVNAVKSNKHKKEWITMRDERVRSTHIKVDRRQIGIFDVFDVGNSVLGYPRDMTYDPEPQEVINCRCRLRYS